MKNPRKACPGCGAVFRYAEDLAEHKRVGCRVEPGKGDSLAPDRDSEPHEDPSDEASRDETPQE